MPDWVKFVREHLSLRECPGDCQAQIVEEIGGQLEDAYQEALGEGGSEKEAFDAACQHVPDWRELAENLERAGFRQARPRQSRLADNAESSTIAPGPRFRHSLSHSQPEKVALLARAGMILSDARQDLHYAMRLFARNPTFSSMAIFAVAIGIGANTAIFSFVNSVLLCPLPYPYADRLVVIQSGQGNANRAPVSSFELFHIREEAKQFEQVAGIWVTNGALPGEGDAEQGKRGVVTSNFLPVLCAKPALGRFFSAEDEDGKHARAIILSHGLWVRRFGSDPAIVGKSVRMEKGSAVVVGVLPANFRLIFPNDASVPGNVDFFDSIPIDPSDPKGPGFLHVIGRLRRGIDVARAQAEAETIAAHLRTLDSDISLSNFRLYVFSLHEDDVREVRTVLLLLFGGVAFVVLIACANVANLVMARAMHRIRETSVCAALGASRGRLTRQLLTESLLLGCLGGVAALGVGWAAVRTILTVRPPSLANFGEVHLDLRVFVFNFVVAILTGAIFGLAPGVLMRRLNLTRGLKEDWQPANWRRFRWTSVLVSVEVALAFALLLGTGLLMRTFVNILHADPGFRADGASTFRISVPNFQSLQQVRQNLSHLPGVESVSAVSHLPLDDAGNWYDYYWKEGAPAEQQNTAMADHRSVLPGYFKTIGATLLQGRDFSDSDDLSHQHVVIVDEVLAQELWPDGKAIGSKLNISDSPQGPYQFQRDWAVVVGIVRHVQCHSLTVAVRPQIYVPYQIAPRPSMSIVIRSALPIPSLAVTARKEVALVNKEFAVTHIEPLSTVVGRARAESRFASLLATLLSAIALLLACAGIYGVLSYSVAQRTSEIGVRMAIGAGRMQVMTMVLADSFLPMLAGLAGGFALSLLVGRQLNRLLFGVTPDDASNYALVLVTVAFVSGMAAIVPARRAMKVDPLAALKCE
jgi:predicted permease